MTRAICAFAFFGLFALAALPASAADDASRCEYMKQVIAGVNEQSGKMIDAITRGETAVLDCDAKTADLKWTITVSSSKLNNGWQQTLKGNIEKLACGDAALKEAMVSGWKVTASWTPVEGEAFTTELACT